MEMYLSISSERILINKDIFILTGHNKCYLSIKDN